MSDKTTLAHGEKWFLQEDSDGIITLEVLSCADISLVRGSDVTLQIPPDLARRISGEPEVKLVPVEGSDLKAHWLHLLQRLNELGAHDKRSARPLSALYYGPTPPSMRGAAAALWRREYLGRTSAPGGSHYWLTEKGRALLKGKA